MRNAYRKIDPLDLISRSLVELIFILNDLYKRFVIGSIRSICFLSSFFFIHFFPRLRNQIIGIFIHTVSLLHSSSYSVFFTRLLLFRFLTVCFFLCLSVYANVGFFTASITKTIFAFFSSIFEIVRCRKEIRVFCQVQIEMFKIFFFSFHSAYFFTFYNRASKYLRWLVNKKLEI